MPFLHLPRLEATAIENIAHLQCYCRCLVVAAFLKALCESASPSLAWLDRRAGAAKDAYLSIRKSLGATC